jgi:hypothetical protein
MRRDRISDEERRIVSDNALNEAARDNREVLICTDGARATVLIIIVHTSQFTRVPR